MSSHYNQNPSILPSIRDDEQIAERYKALICSFIWNRKEIIHVSYNACIPIESMYYMFAYIYIVDSYRKCR